MTNIRGFKQGCGELARVTVDTRAHVVCVTESHLDRDDSIDFFFVYVLLAMRSFTS